MAPTPLPTLLSPSELSYLHTSLALIPPIRPDARSPTSFRPLVAETDLLPSANGSARLCFADGTEAIVGVKGEVEKTVGAVGHDLVEGSQSSEDEEMGGLEAEGMGKGRGEDRWIEVTVDIPEQRDDDAMIVFLAQMIHEGLVADHTLPARLVINSRWHWRLYIDILLLSPPSTYPLPLLSLTTHLALLTTHLPAPISSPTEDPLFNDDWDAAIPLYTPHSSTIKGKTTQKPQDSTSRPPITLLVISVAENIFFDPTHAELAVADAVLAVTVAAPSSSPSPSNTQDGPLSLLAVRTIDPPSRLSSSATDADAGDELGVWKVRKGGMGRGVVGRMVGMCVKVGGMGCEVLGGLEGFI